MSESSFSARPFFTGLRCRECGRTYPKTAAHVCEFDFGPLEAAYDYDAIRPSLTREALASRPHNLWRYRELLPIDGAPQAGASTGFTPLVRADRLARRLGVKELYIKNDAVNHPTLSFKDRVVAVALTRARELGLDTVACASTGNLANSVAAQAAAAGLRCFVFIPADLERGKVLGSLVYGARVVSVRGPYDRVNRLCSEIAGKYGWGFVNVNLRAYYAEGSKTVGYEICEQLGWRAPRHTVVPVASGSLLTKIDKAYREFTQLGLIGDCAPAIYGAQAAGCGPVAEAAQHGRDFIKPVAKPQTIAKSLAIGTPADGHYALRAIRDSRGTAEAATDPEIVEGIRLLAETEGIFAETAGGVTVACARKLIASGVIPRDESIVLCITGNGLKTLEAVSDSLGETTEIAGNLREFEDTILRVPRELAASV
ncbi:MAG: threonine synthase [Verrucomicrobia bacterium]|nr:threonine synthase [Verrucomicrobiota bacterium]